MGPRVRREDAWDLCVGLAFLGFAVVIHLGGSESVPQNREPGVLSVLLTVLAVGPLVVRRRYPGTVLALTLAGLLLLVATRSTVGAATLGCTVAFYTAVAVLPGRRMRVAVAGMALAVGIGLLMHPVDLSPAGAVVTLALFAGAGSLGWSVRARRERFDADVVAARERAARSAADERLRITRDMHDIVGHAMSVMVVQAGVAERLMDTDPERARTAVSEIGATGRRSLAEMRQVIGALREGDPESPMPRDPVPGLDQVAALVVRVESAGLPVTYAVRGDVAGLTPGVGLAVYRVVQESLTNCLKHAAASKATVEVARTGSELRVTVTDDGQGGTTSSRSGESGQGLVGMRERVAVHGGKLVAGPASAGGFRVSARFPL